MGAFAPSPLLDASTEAAVMTGIVEPVLRGMRAEGTEYRGFLYAGLMMTCAGPKVIEFNVRFGDPEAQAVLPLVDGELLPLLVAAADGDRRPRVALKSGVSVGVVLASRATRHVMSGATIPVWTRLAAALRDVFHSGTGSPTRALSPPAAAC